jgi:hypothetical protein
MDLQSQGELGIRGARPIPLIHHSRAYHAQRLRQWLRVCARLLNGKRDWEYAAGIASVQTRCYGTIAIFGTEG